MYAAQTILVKARRPPSRWYRLRLWPWLPEPRRLRFNPPRGRAKLGGWPGLTCAGRRLYTFAMSSQRIYQAIPHREPFLWVEEILEQEDRRIVCAKTFTGKEDFFAGHYPGCPVVPGVLLCEAAMQAGAILLAGYLAAAPGRIPVATRMNDVRFKRQVRPGDTIRLEVELVERLADAFFLRARVTVRGQVAARLDFACTASEPPGPWPPPPNGAG